MACEEGERGEEKFRRGSCLKPSKSTGFRSVNSSTCMPEQVGPTQIWEDNQVCICRTIPLIQAGPLRHINVKVWFLRNMVRDQVIKQEKVHGGKNVAEALSKSLLAPAFHQHCTGKPLWGSRALLSSVGKDSRMEVRWHSSRDIE